MKNCLPIIVLAMLSGCASIVSGTSQEIALTSTPSGANCAISRQGMTLQDVTTPASPTVQKSKYDLLVVCSKSGYTTATKINPSGVEPWVFGNILIGGLIGLVIDMSSGAQNHYETTMGFDLPAALPAAVLPADPTIIKQPVT